MQFAITRPEERRLRRDTLRPMASSHSSIVSGPKTGPKALLTFFKYEDDTKNSRVVENRVKPSAITEAVSIQKFRSQGHKRVQHQTCFWLSAGRCWYRQACWHPFPLLAAIRTETNAV